MALVINSDELVRFGYAAETAFGTAITADASIKEILLPKGVFISPAVKKSDLDLNRSTRVQRLDDVFNDSFTGPARVEVPEIIVTKDRLADLIYACLQNRVSQGLVGTGYSKVFKLHASQPDFTANAGMFFTLAMYSPVAAKSLRIASCIVKSMDIEIDKSGVEDSVLIRLKNVVIIGKKVSTGVTLVPVSWIAQGTSRFNAYAFTFTDVTAANALVPWAKFMLHLDNGAEALGDLDTDGTPKTYFLNPPKMGVAKAEVMHWLNADTTGTMRDFMAAFTAQTTVNSKIVTGTVDTDGYLNIDMNGVLEESPMGNDNRRLIVPAKWLLGDTAAASAVTITIADAISQT